MNPIALLHFIAAAFAGDSLRLFSEQAAAAVVAALWQGTLLVCFLALSLRLFPRVSAAHRFIVWAAAFIVLAGLPLLSSFSAAASSTANVAGAAPFSTGQPLWSPVFNLDVRWSLLIAALWAAASLFRAADLAIHSFQLRALWKSARPVEMDRQLNPELFSALTDCGRRPVQICTTAALQRPCVIGFLKPRILIPDWLYARLSDGELEQIALHELEHLRRRDDWSNLIQKLCLVLFPLNPALVWIERRLCREREMACDEGVIRITRAPRAYAACLASLAERGIDRRAEALSLGAWQRRPELVQRVHSILRGRHALGPKGTRAIVCALTCGLFVVSVLMARCPQLVAFTPERSAQTAAIAAMPESSGARAPRLTNTDCTGTCVPVRMAKGSAKILRSSRTAPTAPLSNVAYAASDAGQTRAVMAKATVGDMIIGDMLRGDKLFGDRPASPVARQQGEQQWIVMATYEQVQTTGTNAQVVADYDIAAVSTDRQPGPQTNVAGSSNRPASAYSATQINITRMIFRILPASSITSQPRVASMRDGWLVLQL